MNDEGWKIEHSNYGDNPIQKIHFSFEDHKFVMIFTVIIKNEYYIDKEIEVEFKFPENSYDVKFDRLENFDAGLFYIGPSSKFSIITFKKSKNLVNTIMKVIDFHCNQMHAELYLAQAASVKLKIFYDRLARPDKIGISCLVINNVFEGKLGYVIKTRYFRFVRENESGNAFDKTHL